MCMKNGPSPITFFYPFMYLLLNPMPTYGRISLRSEQVLFFDNFQAIQEYASSECSQAE